MPSETKHVVILPHFCDEEVARYEKIAEKMVGWKRPDAKLEFLIAASPKRQPSKRLLEAFRPCGDVVPFQCPTQIFGYPEGPTAMFWDCMDFIAERHAGRQGFSLWLESDMCPTQSEWIDVLSRQWFERDADGQLPLMMGCFVPEVYKYRLFKKPKKILSSHINGGACYSLDFATQMPAEAREGVFDMSVFKYASDVGRARETRSICFSTLNRVRRDVANPDKVLLHGFMQEKDEFIEQSLLPLTDAEIDSQRVWNEIREHAETVKRKLRVLFVRKGREAMLENMFLAKQKYELSFPNLKFVNCQELLPEKAA